MQNSRLAEEGLDSESDITASRDRAKIFPALFFEIIPVIILL